MMGIYSSMERNEKFLRQIDFIMLRNDFVEKRPGHPKTHSKNVAKEILQPLPR